MSKRTERLREKRSKERKKDQAQAKHRKHFGGQPQLATKFETLYGPDFLQESGPLLLCIWSPPSAVLDALSAANQPLPRPVTGALLLDTGASSTCISIKAAEQLGLQATRLQDGYGAGGEHKNPVFLARLEIRITDPNTQLVSTFGWEQEVQGIPDLDKCVRELSLAGRAMEVVGILGRDILRHSRVNYDGPAGRLRFEFDVTSLRGTPSR